jgi:hypothetical protein
MAPIDPQDAKNSLEDCARQLDQFVRTANSFHATADDKCTRSVECVVFMITGGRIPTINEMTTDEHGLISMSDIDPVDLRMSTRQLELQGLDLACQENAENMYQMLVNLPAEVITQGESLIHGELSSFFRAEYLDDESNNKGRPLTLLSEI